MGRFIKTSSHQQEGVMDQQKETNALPVQDLNGLQHLEAFVLAHGRDPDFWSALESFINTQSPETGTDMMMYVCEIAQAYEIQLKAASKALQIVEINPETVDDIAFDLSTQLAGMLNGKKLLDDLKPAWRDFFRRGTQNQQAEQRMVLGLN
jgi:hypothetical protein